MPAQTRSAKRRSRSLSRSQSPAPPKKRSRTSVVSAKRSLFERLGGEFAIAAVVNDFSDRLLKNQVVGANSKNKDLSQWHSVDFQTRLPGLKFMRTLWVCALTGGPFQYTGKDLHSAHLRFHIRPEEFDAVVDELANSLAHFKVPQQETAEVLAAFRAQKNKVVSATKADTRGTSAVQCPFA